MSSVDEHRNWLAMQYVLGELSELDCAAFEERLADDLAVCEAVTAASRLVLTVRAALSETKVDRVAVAGSSHSRNVAGSTRGSWLAVAATTAALVLLCLCAIPSPNRTDVASLDPAAAELVSLWRSGTSLGDDESDDMEELADPAGDVAVPGWMLAAVAFEAPETTDEPSEKLQIGRAHV